MASLHAETLSLAEAVRSAHANDPQIRAARATLDVALQKLPEARADLMPVIALTGNASSTSATTTFDGFTPLQRSGNAHEFNLQLVQPLFRADNLLANGQASHLIDYAQSVFDQSNQDLLLRVAASYFAVNEAHDAITAAEAQVTALEHQLDEVSHDYKAGTRAITDVDDTKARLWMARAQLVGARNDLENARGDLERIVGAEALHNRRPAELPATLVLPAPIPDVADEWIAQARNSNPKVVAQRAALEAARYDVERARAGHLPTVDFVVSTGRSYSNHSLTTPDDYSSRATQHVVAVQLNVPLFAGGAVVARVSEAESGLEKVRADLDAAYRDAAEEARHAFNGVTAGLAQVGALQASELAGDSALKGNQAGFRVGYRTNVDVLNAQQQLYAARRDLSKARYDVLLQGLKLKAAVGALVERDLDSIDALFQ